MRGSDQPRWTGREFVRIEHDDYGARKRIHIPPDGREWEIRDHGSDNPDTAITVFRGGYYGIDRDYDIHRSGDLITWERALRSEGFGLMNL